ncbi:hypothetical protein LIPSTDRAFT_55653 [Lipomyces starkeyi NRRL Y-11557]|uniref:N-acetyltransferase domain-containing protein n=1 Tax=Lipomyces starkeyi NRRL Y-11557 TaxID=675824 RepID=A0A1E3Q251_LIPST|nr:hypothetical protein LIPSTDRAFT_55653 [Lipomyces starkeyi NRRL Y-11557]
MAPLPEHVLIRPLGSADIDQVVKLESHTFPSNERAGREKMRYRLHAAPELSSGMFVRVPTKKGRCSKRDCPRSQRSHSSDSASSTEKLIAFVIATKCATEYITDDALEIPEIDKEGYRKPTEVNCQRGHVETGNTIAVESICVDPEYQGMKLGTTILRDFVQRMSTQAVAGRVAILAREDMVPFYENLGFYDAGPSVVKFGGGGWHNLWISLEDSEVDD